MGCLQPEVGRWTVSAREWAMDSEWTLIILDSRGGKRFREGVASLISAADGLGQVRAERPVADFRGGCWWPWQEQLGNWWAQRPRWSRVKGGLGGCEESEYRPSFEELWNQEGSRIFWVLLRWEKSWCFSQDMYSRNFKFFFWNGPPALWHVRTAPVRMCDLHGMEHWFPP